MPKAQKIVYGLLYAWMLLIGVLLIIPPQPPICIVCGADVARTPSAVEFVLGGVTVALGLVGLYATVALNPQPLPPKGTTGGAPRLS
jgi:hypothetical protein